MKAALLGAGLGAGFNMMRGKDPLQGAMLGGLGGGLASGASGYLASGATGPMAKAGASMMMNPVASPSLAGGGLLSNMMAGNTPLDKMVSTINKEMSKKTKKLLDELKKSVLSIKKHIKISLQNK